MAINSCWWDILCRPSVRQEVYDIDMPKCLFFLVSTDKAVMSLPMESLSELFESDIFDCVKTVHIVVLWITFTIWELAFTNWNAHIGNVIHKTTSCTVFLHIRKCHCQTAYLICTPNWSS